MWAVYESFLAEYVLKYRHVQNYKDILSETNSQIDFGTIKMFLNLNLKPMFKRAREKVFFQTFGE